VIGRLGMKKEIHRKKGVLIPIKRNLREPSPPPESLSSLKGKGSGFAV